MIVIVKSSSYWTGAKNSPIFRAIGVVLELVESSAPRRDHVIPNGLVESVKLVAEDQGAFLGHVPGGQSTTNRSCQLVHISYKTTRRWRWRHQQTEQRRQQQNRKLS